RRQGGRRPSRADVKCERGARLHRRREWGGKENRGDFLAGESQRRFHDTHDSDVGLHSVTERRRHPYAAAARGIVGDLRREAIGHDSDLGYFAPIRRDKSSALNEVEPEGPEIITAGRTTY